MGNSNSSNEEIIIIDYQCKKKCMVCIHCDKKEDIDTFQQSDLKGELSPKKSAFCCDKTRCNRLCSSCAFR